MGERFWARWQPRVVTAVADVHRNTNGVRIGGGSADYRHTEEKLQEIRGKWKMSSSQSVTRATVKALD